MQMKAGPVTYCLASAPVLIALRPMMRVLNVQSRLSGVVMSGWFIDRIKIDFCDVAVQSIAQWGNFSLPPQARLPLSPTWISTKASKSIK